MPPSSDANGRGAFDFVAASLPQLISCDFNSSGTDNQVNAALRDIADRLRRQLRRRGRRVESDDSRVEHRARHGLAVRGPAHRRVVHADHRAARHLRAELRRLQGGGGRVADVSGTCRGRVALQHLDVRR